MLRGPSGHRGIIAISVLAVMLQLTSASSAAVAAPSAARSTAASPTDTVKPIQTVRWGPRMFAEGRFEHTRLAGGLVLGAAADRVGYDDPYGGSGRVAYDRGRWYSPWHSTGFGFTELIASYQAVTPIGTFIEVSVRGTTTGGRRSSWDSLGRWASHDRSFHRMSPGAQLDDYSRVAVDTLKTDAGVTFRSWQLRVTLMRRAGSAKTPAVARLAAVASRLPSTSPTSAQAVDAGRELRVPRYSQQIHEGEYPRWDGGGEAWCSPTSTSMVLAFWGRGPTPKQYAWVDDDYAQPWVDYAARYTYAWGYDGTGDWPFNTAYAARFGLDAFVTRLRSLREAERFIHAGVPLVASISFGPGQLDNAPIRSSNGHVVVITGFTAGGKVIVNDPAGANATKVRRVYRRDQFENAWSDKGGVVYVIHPASTRLPAPGHHSNW